MVELRPSQIDVMFDAVHKVAPSKLTDLGKYQWTYGYCLFLIGRWRGPQNPFPDSPKIRVSRHFVRGWEEAQGLCYWAAYKECGGQPQEWLRVSGLLSELKHKFSAEHNTP